GAVQGSGGRPRGPSGPENPRKSVAQLASVAAVGPKGERCGEIDPDQPCGKKDHQAWPKLSDRQLVVGGRRLI
uniref:Uncharacterized protein n=1 Tax=Triticum urartu TaxID=4572 RepID=A0A8R7QH84_TRIUA